MKLIKGDTLEKQMKHVDKILKSYSYQLRKTVTGIITPFPVSNYSDLSGIVLRYMFPIAGKITVGGVYIEQMPKAGVDIEITVFDGLMYNSKTIVSKRNSIAINPNFKAVSGTRLTVKVTPVIEEEIASGIWTAFLWTPEINEAEVKQFLTNSLVKEADNVTRQIEES